MNAVLDNPDSRAKLKRDVEHAFATLVAMTPRIGAIKAVILEALPLADRTIITDMDRRLMVLHARAALAETHKVMLDGVAALLPVMIGLFGQGYTIGNDCSVHDPAGHPVRPA